MNITQNQADEIMNSLARLTCNYLGNMVDLDNEKELEDFTEWINSLVRMQFITICDILEVSNVE